MASVQILYWRDIPAQVIAKAGRKSAKRQLNERFEKAIDMAAMRSGASSTDEYLSDWRRGEPAQCGDNLDVEVERLANDLETTFDDARLRSLVDAGGYQSKTSAQPARTGTVVETEWACPRPSPPVQGTHINDAHSRGFGKEGNRNRL